jgi:MFS family permease
MLSSPRSALLAVFCALGAMIGGFAGSFPVIMQNSGIGPFEFGVGLMISMAADVLAMTAAGFLAWRYSNRTMLLLLLPYVGLANFSFMTSASTTVFYLTTTAYGLVVGATLQMPCSYALAASYAADNRLGALSFVGFIVGTPRIVAPMIFGWVASNHGISSSFGLLTAALAVALVLAFSLAGLQLIPQPQETI